MTNGPRQRLAIARGLQLAGRTDAALAAYIEVLAIVPDHHVARREVALLSIARGDEDRAITELATYLAACPLDTRAHHAYIGAVTRQRGLAAALAHYGLTCDDERPLPDADVCSLLVVRDEIDRLGFTLDYHRALGVDAFVVIDNGSSDGTTRLLQGRPDVHRWSTAASYRLGCAGYAWVAAVLAATGRSGWWLLVDADELFTYPPGDSLRLPDLCRALDAEGAGGLEAVLVDCYPEGPLSASAPRAAQDPRIASCWFDRDWRTGARQRRFPVDGGYLLTKAPLVRWDPEVVVEPGAHVAHGVTLSMSRRAALLHFKLLAGMDVRSSAEVARGDVIVAEHQASYVEALRRDAELSLFEPASSVRYVGPEQLVALGIVR